MKQLVSIFLVGTLSVGITTKAWTQTGGTVSFENNSVSGFVGGGSSETAAVNSNTDYVRTGNYSLGLSSTSTSTIYWYALAFYSTSGTGPNNVHQLYWAKASATSMVVDASMRYQTVLPLTGSGSASNSTPNSVLSSSAWTL